MLSVKKQKGFSLAEVLMATGILALGMVFVAGLFPAAIYFTAISTERTMAVAVADEAFAKIRLYGVDVNLPPTGVLPQVGNSNQTVDFSAASIIKSIPIDEFGYPSINGVDKGYCWSALCRRVSGARPGETLVQVTVFVCRRTMAGAKYYRPDSAGNFVPGQISDWPAPVKVGISNAVGKEFTIMDNTQRTFISAGSTIVEDTSGRIYRVLSRNDVVHLDRPWVAVSGPIQVWVMPPPVGGGRYPCVGVFQKEILF